MIRDIEWQENFGRTLLFDSAYFTSYDLVIVWIQLGSIIGF